MDDNWSIENFSDETAKAVAELYPEERDFASVVGKSIPKKEYPDDIATDA